jgi:hypothetical protein
MASIFYGEPRFTNDVDIVVNLPLSKVSAFCRAFPAPAFYCALLAAEEAVRTKTQFNILQPALGVKADVIVASDSEFDRSLMARRIQGELIPGLTAMIAAPEDVILKKLEYFKMGGSEKHLRDIAGVVMVQAEAIDREYLATWIARLNLATEWQLVKDRLEKNPG